MRTPSLRHILCVPFFALLAACAADASTSAGDEEAQADPLVMKPGGGFVGGGPAIACYRSCSFWGTECAAGEICSQGECRTRPMHHYCDTPTTSRNDAGDRVDCSSYGCDPATGLCRRSCDASDQCSPGSVCDTGEHRCDVVFSWYGNVYYGQGGSDFNLPRATPLREVWDRCANNCTSDSQCRSHEMCYFGSCEVLAPHCSQDGNAEVGWDRVPRSCGEYKCGMVRGACFTDCRTTDDCQPGFVCDGNACIRP